jgi:hypothetical protein
VAARSRHRHASGQAIASRPHLRDHDPPGYRDWDADPVAHERATSTLRGRVGERRGDQSLPRSEASVPDGAIIAALHWSHVSSEKQPGLWPFPNPSLPGPHERSVHGKDATRYAATGGWGFGHFNNDGEPGDETMLNTCSPCHAKASRDSVFTQYAPSILRIAVRRFKPNRDAIPRPQVKGLDISPTEPFCVSPSGRSFGSASGLSPSDRAPLCRHAQAAASRLFRDPFFKGLIRNLPFNEKLRKLASLCLALKRHVGLSDR